VTLVVLAKSITEGDFYPDAARNAMDGIVVHDIIKELPFSNIFEYLKTYYTQYPALSLGHHPPFFAFIEALFYLIFGISQTTARLTVLGFAILAVIFWYRLIKSIYNEKIALFSGIIFITSPLIVYWAKDVMLDMPPLALVIGSIYFFHNYIDLGKRRHAYYLAVCLSLAVLTRQTAVFLIPLFLIYILIKRRHDLLISKEALISYIIILGLLLPLLIVTLKFNAINIKQSVGDLGPYSRTSLDNWIYYFRKLPWSLAIPQFILSLSGIAVTLYSIRYDKRALIFLLWILVGYLFFSYISNKQVRYAYFLIPPFSLFSILVLDKIKGDVLRIRFSVILMTLLSVFYLYQAYTMYIPKISGYEEAAKFIIQNPKGDTVLFEGVHNGNFIFNVRKHDPEKKQIILRGTKLLVSFPVTPEWGVDEHVKTEQDIYRYLDSLGTKYVVIEDKEFMNIPAFKMLREMLNSDNFNLVRKFRLDTNVDQFKDVSLLVYEYKKDVRITEDQIDIRLPIVGRDFKGSLKPVLQRRLRK
jgi:hypothetical protein